MTPPHLDITRDGTPAAADTILQAAGADNVLIVSTTTHGLTLRSIYTGAGGTDSHVTHLALPRDQPAQIATHAVSSGQLPVTHARQLCLTDHAARLRDELGPGTAVTVTDAAARATAQTY